MFAATKHKFSKCNCISQQPNLFVCADSLNSAGTLFGLSRLGLCFENRNRDPKGHKVLFTQLQHSVW